MESWVKRWIIILSPTESPASTNRWLFFPGWLINSCNHKFLSLKQSLTTDQCMHVHLKIILRNIIACCSNPRRRTNNVLDWQLAPRNQWSLGEILLLLDIIVTLMTILKPRRWNVEMLVIRVSPNPCQDIFSRDPPIKFLLVKENSKINIFSMIIQKKK